MKAFILTLVALVATSASADFATLIKTKNLTCDGMSKDSRQIQLAIESAQGQTSLQLSGSVGVIKPTVLVALFAK